MFESLLSPSQLDVLKFLVLGYSNKQIAAKLIVSESTVKAHVKEILYRFNVTNRIQAAIIAANFFGVTGEQIYEAVDEIRREKENV